MAEALRRTFAECKKAGRPAFIPFLTAGYPTPQDTVPLLLAMEKAGADIIEIGVPFSHPMADGASIQFANTIAVEHNISFKDCLNYVREARKLGLRAPIILMGYVNPLLQYGLANVAKDAAEAGANGFIVVDLPIEEAADFLSALSASGLSFVPLLAPTTRPARLKKLCEVADSFVYCVSVAGVTGERKELPKELPHFLGRVREATKLPAAVGFGVSTRDHFLTVQRIADAVVVGSAVVNAVKGLDSQAARVKAISDFIRSLVAPAAVPAS